MDEWESFSILKLFMFKQEGLISDEQYKKLLKKDSSLELKSIADIIKTVML